MVEMEDGKEEKSYFRPMKMSLISEPFISKKWKAKNGEPGRGVIRMAGEEILYFEGPAWNRGPRS